MTTSQKTMRSDSVSQVAKEAFASGFFTKNQVRDELHAETQVRLAMALMGSGVSYGQVNALALAVRDVGGLEPNDPDAAVTAKQRAQWDQLVAEKALPAPFKDLLEAVGPKLQKRRDLYALYGVLAGTLERLGALVGMSELVAKG